MPINENTKYMISDHGSVYSLNIKRNIKLQTDKDGYHIAGLSFEGKKTLKKVSRLVQEHFGDDWNPELQVDHIDRIRTNNHYSNLRMLTSCGNSNNKGIDPKNTSGFAGVTYALMNGKYMRSKPWKATISTRGHSKVKYFYTAEGADIWRKLEVNKINLSTL